jgi:hypothetical protein
MKKIKVIECVENKLVAEVDTWDEAYAMQQDLQQKSINDGFDLNKFRYAVRTPE